MLENFLRTVRNYIPYLRRQLSPLCPPFHHLPYPPKLEGVVTGLLSALPTIGEHVITIVSLGWQSWMTCFGRMMRRAK
jgi:hypothetical protein